jgi:hypothetical protein
MNEKPNISRSNKKFVTQKEFNRIADFLFTQHKMSKEKKIAHASKIVSSMGMKRIPRKAIRDKLRKKVKLMDVNELYSRIILLGEHVILEEKKKKEKDKHTVSSSPSTTSTTNNGKYPFWRNVAERSLGAAIGGAVPTAAGIYIGHRLTKR